jgi:hypothetical protein
MLRIEVSVLEATCVRPLSSCQQFYLVVVATGDAIPERKNVLEV